MDSSKTSNSAGNDNEPSKKLKQDHNIISKSKMKVGDWVLHTSSSGKDYYYNVTSRASKWEKPKEWLDYEKLHRSGVSGTSESGHIKSEYKPKPQQQQHQYETMNSCSISASLLRLQQLDRNQQQLHNRRSFLCSDNSVVSHRGNSLNNFRHSTSITTPVAVQDTRKLFEDKQTDDIDISSLNNNSSPHTSQGSNPRGSTSTSMTNLSQRNTNHSNDTRGFYNRSNQEVKMERSMSGSKVRDERSRSPWDNDLREDENVGSLLPLPTLLGHQGLSESPSITPSLAQYYRDDLIKHVKNLPGAEIEGQANKVIDDILTQAAIRHSEISTQLKIARNEVRVTDIQSTLMDQRLLFLREQMMKLEQSEHPSLMGLNAV